MVNPTSVSCSIVASGREEVVVRQIDGTRTQVTGDAARLLPLLDGSRDAATLAALLGVETDRVYAALEVLADADLLVRRVSRPPSLRRAARRGLLAGLAMAARRSMMRVPAR
jgi:hypothetical protein